MVGSVSYPVGRWTSAKRINGTTHLPTPHALTHSFAISLTYLLFFFQERCLMGHDIHRQAIAANPTDSPLGTTGWMAL